VEHVTWAIHENAVFLQHIQVRRIEVTPMIMIAYYVITAFLLALAAWNFVREKDRRQDLVLYLLVMIPLILRLLRWK
jgi:hypothetical protein